MTYDTSRICEVFANAAASYNVRIGGDYAPAALIDRDSLKAFYMRNIEKLIDRLRSRPLSEICKANHIGREGQNILATEIHNSLHKLQLSNKDLER